MKNIDTLLLFLFILLTSCRQVAFIEIYDLSQKDYEPEQEINIKQFNRILHQSNIEDKIYIYKHSFIRDKDTVQKMEKGMKVCLKILLPNDWYFSMRRKYVFSGSELYFPIYKETDTSTSIKLSYDTVIKRNLAYKKQNISLDSLPFDIQTLLVFHKKGLFNKRDSFYLFRKFPFTCVIHNKKSYLTTINADSLLVKKLHYKW